MGKIPCCDQIGLKKGPWTPEEDQKLLDFIQKHGHGRWRLLPKNAGLKRCGKSCRLRWANYLRPDIKRGRFSFEEEEIIIQLHSVLGNKWSAIASRLPGRTDNEIKNYWNTHIRKRLLKMGIDPVTHTPRLDLLELSSVLCSTLYNSSSSSSSSQLNLPNLLGIGPIMDPDLLNLATTLLSQHHVHQQNQLGLFQVNNQNQFQPCSLFQPNHQQLQNPVREIPSCTTSNTLHPQFLNHQTQLMQTKEEHFSPSLTKLWQSNGDQAPNVAADQSFVPITNQLGSYGSNHQSINISQKTCISNNVHGDHHKLQNMSFLFTPSSSYVNSGSTEDEKDSFCSNILMYDMINPNGLNV